MPRHSRLLAPLLLACALVACANDQRLPGEFDAGPVDDFPLRSVVTFADGVEVQRATTQERTGTHLFGGRIVFHLVRFESGEFVALHARDTHSECWIFWDPDAELPGTERSEVDPGWFRDPCHGAMYDEQGARVFGPAPRDLDRYPVSIRDGRIYVTLTESALVPGTTHVQ